jgi:ribosomal protein S18 acetylase RimI-like enzyme
MNEASIRRATSADTLALSLIGSATFLETFAGVVNGADVIAHCASEHSTAVYESILTGSDAGVWLAESLEGAAPVGYAVLDRAKLPVTDPQPDDVEIKRIYVLGRFHGTGVGARLMEAALDEATRRGARRALLGVYAHNQRALAFYAKHGFTRIGERRFQVGANTYGDYILARQMGL